MHRSPSLSAVRFFDWCAVVRIEFELFCAQQMQWPVNFGSSLKAIENELDNTKHIASGIYFCLFTSTGWAYVARRHGRSWNHVPMRNTMNDEIWNFISAIREHSDSLIRRHTGMCMLHGLTRLHWIPNLNATLFGFVTMAHVICYDVFQCAFEWTKEKLKMKILRR